MDGETIGLLVGIVALTGVGVGAWVAVRERIVRAETKLESLELQHRDHKSDFVSLREWLETQFDMLRRDLSRKADRDK